MGNLSWRSLPSSEDADSSLHGELGLDEEQGKHRRYCVAQDPHCLKGITAYGAVGYFGFNFCRLSFTSTHLRKQSLVSVGIAARPYIYFRCL